MRTKVTLVLVFLNVALFFFIFKFERIWRIRDGEIEARRRVLGPEGADIRRLEITTPNHASDFGLERRRDAWFLTKPFEWPANFHTAAAIANALQVLEHETSFKVEDLAKSGQSLASYGLDKPKVTVAFSSGDLAAGGFPTKTELQIGDTTRDGKRVYLLSPDGKYVHVVDRSKIDVLTPPIEQLRADTLFSVRVFEARSIGVQMAASGAEAARTAVAPLRMRIRRDPAGNRWTFETPINAQASRTAVELAISELNTLHVKSFPPASAAPAPSGAPAVQITLEGNNRSEKMFLGEAVATPQPPTAKPANATEYYAQLDGRNALFTVVVPNALLETLRNAPETLREKRFLDFLDPRAVTAVTIKAPVQPNLAPITLQRLDPAAGQPRDNAPSWQLVRRADGGQGPQTFPADPATVQRLLERLALLSAERFKSDAPTQADIEEWGFNRPAREISLTLSGRSTPIVLQLGTDAARNVYARIGTDPSASIYSVSADLIDHASLSPLAWRDRAVGEPLPANAKITAIRLVDLENKNAPIDIAFGPNGEPTPAPGDPKAVQSLIAALRNLRAKEFLPGGYTEKVPAGGEERPWRYELTATIALPGAAAPAQTSTLALSLTERIGGNEQFAGSKSLDVVFALEQPMIDALWSLAYGARELGPKPEKK
jgi:hypothetical protein